MNGQAIKADRVLQALRLVNSGRGMGLTDHAITLVSRQAKRLLEDGLIEHAPMYRAAYKPTVKGQRMLDDNAHVTLRFDGPTIITCPACKGEDTYHRCAR